MRWIVTWCDWKSIRISGSIRWHRDFKEFHASSFAVTVRLISQFACARVCECVFLFFRSPHTHSHHSLFMYDTLILKYIPPMHRYIRFGHMNVLDFGNCLVHRSRQPCMDVRIHYMNEMCVYAISTKRCFVFRIYYIFSGLTHTHTPAQWAVQSHMCQSFISFQLNFGMNQIKSKAFHFASHGPVYGRFIAKIIIDSFEM